MTVIFFDDGHEIYPSLKQPSYSSRDNKPDYLSRRYGRFIGSSVLDVGADQCQLKKRLGRTVNYVGVGYGNVSVDHNLEKTPLPFGDQSFETVVCTDVLEHIDNIHDLFDELCRVSKKNIIISLPNAWASIYEVLFFRNYKDKRYMKFYGLPLSPPEDRHKWFFSLEEAYCFVKENGERNGFKIADKEYTGFQSRGSRLKSLVLCLIEKFIVNSKFNKENFRYHTVWIVLQRESG